jgi:hypothetical protein
VTALAYAGIALFGVAVVVVAIGMSKQAVRYVRDVRSMVRAGLETSVRDKQLEDDLSLGERPHTRRRRSLVDSPDALFAGARHSDIQRSTDVS